jgi:hypothetical protein
MDSGFTWGGGVTDSLEIPRGYFGVYWYDRGPTTPEGLERAIKDYERTGDASALQYLTKKELYRRTRDPRFLVRTPSLDDPAVLDVLRQVAFTAARNKAVYDMDYYFVGTRDRSRRTRTPSTSTGESTPWPASATGCGRSTARWTRSTRNGARPSRAGKT